MENKLTLAHPDAVQAASRAAKLLKRNKTISYGSSGAVLTVRSEKSGRAVAVAIVEFGEFFNGVHYCAVTPNGPGRIHLHSHNIGSRTTIERLAATIEQHEIYMPEHSRSVTTVAGVDVWLLGCIDERLRRVSKAAISLARLYNGKDPETTLAMVAAQLGVVFPDAVFNAFLADPEVIKGHADAFREFFDDLFVEEPKECVPVEIGPSPDDAPDYEHFHDKNYEQPLRPDEDKVRLDLWDVNAETLRHMTTPGLITLYNVALHSEEWGNILQRAFNIAELNNQQAVEKRDTLINLLASYLDRASLKRMFVLAVQLRHKFHHDDVNALKDW